MFVAVIQSLFAVFPTWFVAAFLSLIGIVMIVLVIKLVIFVLDALPFL